MTYDAEKLRRAVLDNDWSDIIGSRELLAILDDLAAKDAEIAKLKEELYASIVEGGNSHDMWVREVKAHDLLKAEIAKLRDELQAVRDLLCSYASCPPGDDGLVRGIQMLHERGEQLARSLNTARLACRVADAEIAVLKAQRLVVTEPPYTRTIVHEGEPYICPITGKTEMGGTIARLTPATREAWISAIRAAGGDVKEGV